MKRFIGGPLRRSRSVVLAGTLLALLAQPLAVAGSVSPKQSIVSSGPIQIEPAPFPGVGNVWNFTVTKQGSFKPGDWVDLALIDAAGKELASDFEYLPTTGLGSASLKFTLTIYSGLTPEVVSAGITARLEIDPSDWQASLETYNLMLASSTFPPAPTAVGDYVKFSKASYTFEKRSGCAYQSVDLTVNDPYSEISSIEVSLQTNSGVEIASDTVRVDRALNINFASLYLCLSDFQKFAGNQKLALSVRWSANGKPPLSANAKGLMSPFSAAALSAISKLKNFCVKGSTYKSTTGNKCPAGFKLATFKEPTVAQWNSLARNPSSSKGGNFRIFACISQFDSVTGPSAFRAYSSRIESTSYYSETNSFFKGNSKQLLAYSEDDAVVANVSVIGKYTYSTLGGKTSVPHFQVRDIKKIGQC